MIDRTRVAELRNEVGAEDFAEVVALFCEEMEETLDRIARPGTPVLPDDLHFLKGSALNVGMIEVGRLCLAAERLLHDTPGATPDLGQIARAFRESRNALSLELGP